MQFVSDRWYEGYTRAVTLLSGILLLGSILVLAVPGLGSIGARSGLSYVTLFLAAFELVYILGGYKLIKEKIGLFGATMIVNFMFMFNIVILINGTGRLHSWYNLLWLVVVLFSGMFSGFATAGFCFLSLMYLLLIITEVPGRFTYEPFSIEVTVGIIALGIVSYFFWRRMYVTQESSKIAQLSGQLKGNRLQSEILINSISDGIILIGTDGKINLLNPAAAAMTEWSIEEATGIDVETVLKLNREDGKPLDLREDPIKQVLNEEKQVNMVLQLVGRNQKTMIVSLVVSPVILPKAKAPIGAVAVIRDVSVSRAEERRSADFISTASHEMRTPVAAIEGYLALALNDRVSHVDQKARGFLEKAHSSTQALGTLFQDLLTSAKTEDGRLVSHPSVVEMGSYLEQLSEGLRFAAEKKGLLVDFMLGSEGETNAVGGGRMIKPLYYTYVDPERMREVVTNLFDNAVKYTETGKITIGLTGNAQVVQLSVHDTGPGIPADDIPHLFQKFYRVDTSATRTIGGTGLGLFICRKIVELYKGRIWVESVVGKGSSFFINLPRLETKKAEAMQKTKAADPLSGSIPTAPSLTPSAAANISGTRGTISNNISTS